MRSLSSLVGVATRDVLLYYIVHIYPIVLLLEQFQGFSLARVAGYQQIVYMFKELKLKLIVIRDNKTVLVIQAVSISFIFTKRNLLRASNAILNQLKHLLDKFIIWVFINYNLFNQLVSYFKNAYYKIFSRGIKQFRAEQGLVTVRTRFFLYQRVL